MNRLLCAIYREASGGDCTNGGLSSKVTQAFIIWDTNERPIDTPVFVLCPGRGRREWMAIPLDLFEDEGPLFLDSKRTKPRLKHWVMFGGNFLHTSDGRFPSDQPIHIHDRVEEARGGF